MSERVSLLPCPFCGSERVALGDNESKEWSADTFFAVCEAEGCGARGPAIHNGSEQWVRNAEFCASEGYQRAAAAWNRRVHYE